MGDDAIARGRGVDIFVAPIENGAPCGRRRHLFRASDGTWIPALPTVSGPSGHSFGVVAVPVPEGGLAPVAPPSRLHPAAARWISGLCASLPAVPGSAADVVIGPAVRTDVAEGLVAVAERGHLLWVRVESGTVALMGRPSAIVGAGGIFPLSGHAFAVAGPGSAGLVALDTEPTFEGAWRDGMDRLHRAVLEHWINVLGAEQGDRIEREQALARQNRNAAEWAVRTLAQAISPDTSLMTGLAGAGIAGALLTAAIHGGADRARLRAALAAAGEMAGQDMTQALRLARLAKIPVRPVMLRNDWWDRDGPPMVVWSAEAGRPLAALAVDGRYRLRDPETGTDIDVAQADQLHPSALCIYPQLPARPVGAGDLIAVAVRGARKDALVIAALTVTAALAAMLPALAADLLVSTVLPHTDRSLLGQVVAGMVVAALGNAAFGAIRNLVVLRIEGRASWRLQSAMFDRLLRLSAQFFRQYGTGDLADRALAIENCRRMMSQGTLQAVFAGVSALGNLVLLFVYDNRLAFLALGLSAVAVLAVTIAGRLSLRAWTAEAAARGRVDNLVYQMVVGIAKLRTAGAETRAMAAWAERFAEMKRHGIAAQVAGAWLSVFDGLFIVLASAALYGTAWLLFGSAEDGGALPARSTGSFLAFNAAFGMLIGGLTGGAKALVMLLAAVPLFERARPLLTAEARDLSDGADPGRLTGQIEFNHVTFRYRPELPPVLNGLSLSIEPGQFVALVGPSGGGKSTIIRLMLGFEFPEAGGIFLDGRALSTLDIAAVRRQIGTVLQNGRVMAGTVFDNIVGTGTASLDEVWEAAAMAGLDADIRAMPMGLHTMLLDGGGTLSGGQRQRLMIARALFRRPKILLFDEATSALDNVTQAIVSHSLERLGATRIVVAHRLSTIRDADLIHVIKDGQVHQSGTFADLTGQPGLFASLVARQTFERAADDR